MLKPVTVSVAPLWLLIAPWGALVLIVPFLTVKSPSFSIITTFDLPSYNKVWFWKSRSIFWPIAIEYAFVTVISFNILIVVWDPPAVTALIAFCKSGYFVSPIWASFVSLLSSHFAYNTKFLTLLPCGCCTYWTTRKIWSFIPSSKNLVHLCWSWKRSAHCCIISFNWIG